MRFQIVNLEPKAFPFNHFLDDAILSMCFGLESLGHDCSLAANTVATDRTNIVCAGHLLTDLTQVDAIAAAGPYIAVQGEVIRTNGVNTASNRDQVDRVYLPFLRGAIAVWDGMADSVTDLKALGINAHLMLGGYHPKMEQVVHKNEKDIDFSFYGSTTPHRALMLEGLRDRGFQVTMMFDDRRLYRNDLIARTKVNLMPKQSAEMDHLAWQRLSFLLCNRSLAVVERCRDQQWLEHCFVSASTEHWVDLCVQTLHRHDREALTQTFHDRFREMPLTDRLEKLLDESLGKQTNHMPPRPHGGFGLEQATGSIEQTT